MTGIERHCHEPSPWKLRYHIACSHGVRVLRGCGARAKQGLEGHLTNKRRSIAWDACQRISRGKLLGEAGATGSFGRAK